MKIGDVVRIVFRVSDPAVAVPGDIGVLVANVDPERVAPYNIRVFRTGRTLGFSQLTSFEAISDGH